MKINRDVHRVNMKISLAPITRPAKKKKSATVRIRRRTIVTIRIISTNRKCATYLMIIKTSMVAEEAIPAEMKISVGVKII